MDAPLTSLTPNDIESIRRRASLAGDCDTSSLCNQALWGDSHQKRTAAKRKLAKLIAAEVG